METINPPAADFDLPEQTTRFKYGKYHNEGKFAYRRTINGIDCYGFHIAGENITNYPAEFVTIIDGPSA